MLDLEPATRTLAAMQDEAAWSGMTRAGGLDLPGELAGVIALNEVIVHSWDIAAASGQPFSCYPALVEAAVGFVQPTASQLIGLTGRQSKWSA
jgi:hypothetical protein